MVQSCDLGLCNGLFSTLGNYGVLYTLGD